MTPRVASQTDRIEGPQGEEVAVRFYEDGAIRLEVKGGPWAISQAWLPGGEGANILLVREQTEDDELPIEVEPEPGAVEVDPGVPGPEAEGTGTGTVDTTDTD